MAADKTCGPQLTLRQTLFRPARAIRLHPSKCETDDAMNRCMTRGGRCCSAAALLVAAFAIAFRAGICEGRARRRCAIRSTCRAIAASTPRRCGRISIPHPDGRFDEAARDAALKTLLATGLFDKVKIDRDGERLVVHLAEAPVLDRVAFEGNKKIQDKELTAVIESKPRGTLQRADGAGGCRPHHRSLPPCRARRCPRGAADHRPRQRSGRPRLCGDGGCEDDGAADQLRGQPRFSASGSSPP